MTEKLNHVIAFRINEMTHSKLKQVSVSNDKTVGECCRLIIGERFSDKNFDSQNQVYEEYTLLNENDVNHCL